MTEKKTLPELRLAIDDIDKQLLNFLNQRAELALAIGEIKRIEGTSVFRPERESQVISDLNGINYGPLKKNNISGIWREIMSSCRSLEAPQRVAFLGPQGTFSEEATISFFGSNIELMPMTDFDEIFHAASSGAADYGVVPIENSTEGVVTRSLDLLLNSPLHIIGEVSLLIRHHLLALTQDLSKITVICAHPQALAQCQSWLKTQMPHIKLEAVSSNAEGARLASENVHYAAVGSERAGSIFGLHMVARAIQDSTCNRTRFVVTCLPSITALPQQSGRDCTSLVVSIANRPGAVHELLTPLKKYNVSMTRFESRPSKAGHWEYFFYIDVLGHPMDEHIAKALAEMEQLSTFYKLLGVFHVAD
jgi:chorismate mutase / prephenate dehydratase